MLYFSLACGLFLSLSCYVFMFLSDFHTRDNGAGLIALVVIPLPRTLNKAGTAQTPVSCCGPFSLVTQGPGVLTRQPQLHYPGHTHVSLLGKGVQEAKLVCTVFDTVGLLFPPPPIYKCICARAHARLSVCLPVCVSVCRSQSLGGFRMLRNRARLSMVWDGLE